MMAFNEYMSKTPLVYECLSNYAKSSHGINLADTFEPILKRIMKETWEATANKYPQNSVERISQTTKNALSEAIKFINSSLKQPQVSPRPQSNYTQPESRSIEDYTRARNDGINTPRPDAKQVMKKIQEDAYKEDKPMTNEEMSSRLKNIINDRKFDKETNIEKPQGYDDIQLIPLDESPETQHDTHDNTLNVSALADKLAKKFESFVSSSTTIGTPSPNTFPRHNVAPSSSVLRQKPDPLLVNTPRNTSYDNTIENRIKNMSAQLKTLQTQFSDFVNSQSKQDSKTIIHIKWDDTISIWTKTLPSNIHKFINNKRHINSIIGALSDKTPECLSIVDLDLHVPCVRHIVNCTNCSVHILECKGSKPITIALPHTELITKNYIQMISNIMEEHISVPIALRMCDNGLVEIYFKQDNEQFRDTIINVPSGLFRWVDGDGQGTILTGHLSYMLDVVAVPPSKINVVFRGCKPQHINIPFKTNASGKYTLSDITHSQSCWINTNGTVDVFGFSTIGFANKCGATIMHDGTDCVCGDIKFILQVERK